MLVHNNHYSTMAANRSEPNPYSLCQMMPSSLSLYNCIQLSFSSSWELQLFVIKDLNHFFFLMTKLRKYAKHRLLKILGISVSCRHRNFSNTFQHILGCSRHITLVPSILMPMSYTWTFDSFLSVIYLCLTHFCEFSSYRMVCYSDISLSVLRKVYIKKKDSIHVFRSWNNFFR